MKKVIDASIGSIKFSLEEDAYTLLKDYLIRFEATIEKPEERKEVMEDVEIRVAEILQKEQSFDNQVIDKDKVQIVIDHLGDVGEPSMYKQEYHQANNEEYIAGNKKIFRSTEDKMFAGICGGFGAYFNIDPVIIRIIFVLLVLVFGTGILAYFILWIIIPKAISIPQKLEMRGYATTAENIRKFTANNK